MFSSTSCTKRRQSSASSRRHPDDDDCDCGTAKSARPCKHNSDYDDDDDDADTVATEILHDVPYCMRLGNLERHHVAYAVDHRLHVIDEDDNNDDDAGDLSAEDDEEMPTSAVAVARDATTRARPTISRRYGTKLQRRATCTALLIFGAFLVLGLEVSDMAALARRIWHHGGHVAQRALCSTGPTALAANRAHRALSSLYNAGLVDNDDGQGQGQGHRQLCESKYPCVPDPATGSVQHCTKNNVAGWWISATNAYYTEQYIANNVAYVLTITECPADGQMPTSSSKWNSNTDATSLSVVYDT